MRRPRPKVSRLDRSKPDKRRPVSDEPRLALHDDPLGLSARVIYRDPHIIIIDKPAGIPVHGGAKGGANIEDGLDALRFEGTRRPGLAHRLDKDTSGCLALGRDRETLSRLGRMFVSGRVSKIYWAVVEGQPKADTGKIALNLSKLEKKRGWKMRIDPKGQEAVTFFRVLGRSERFSWLELSPKTGRTHQLRVHCAAKGFPILGDPVYGRSGEGGPRLQLHARALALPLTRGKPIEAIAPVPEDMAAALSLCGWDADYG